MSNLNRWEPFRGAANLHEQLNRVFGEGFGRIEEESNLTTWAPAVDILENEHELVVKADVPDVNPHSPHFFWSRNLLTQTDTSFTFQNLLFNFLRCLPEK